MTEATICAECNGSCPGIDDCSRYLDHVFGTRKRERLMEMWMLAMYLIKDDSDYILRTRFHRRMNEFIERYKPESFDDDRWSGIEVVYNFPRTYCAEEAVKAVQELRNMVHLDFNMEG